MSQVGLLPSGLGTWFQLRKFTMSQSRSCLLSLRAFRCYVDGVHHFNLFTHHKPKAIWMYSLLSLYTPGRQTRWSEHLHPQRFNFTWKYRLGRTNVPDPLSRTPSYHPVPFLLLHALHAQLNVSTCAGTAPAREAAKAAALQSPASLPNPTFL